MQYIGKELFSTRTVYILSVTKDLQNVSVTKDLQNVIYQICQFRHLKTLEMKKNIFQPSRIDLKTLYSFNGFVQIVMRVEFA